MHPTPSLTWDRVVTSQRRRHGRPALSGSGRRCLPVLLLLGLLLMPSAFAQDEGATIAQGVDLLGRIQQAGQPGQISNTLLIVLLVTVLSMAPAILVMTTPFTRIIVIFGFIRQAMGTQQTPPNQVLVGLALFLTFFIMRDSYQQVYDEAVAPYVAGTITQEEAFTNGLKPLREFMFRQVNPRDLALFIRIARLERPNTPADVPTHVLIPAYVVSELRKAFEIGFLIYIPFLIIDMVVASTLMSMGMMMLPPIMVSLPFKIIMFVLADGWGLITTGLIQSFN